MAVLASWKPGIENGPPLVFLPSQTPVNGFGPPLFNNGLFYVQYGASAPVANSTAETSILNDTPATTVGFYTQGSAAAYPASTLVLQKGLLGIGTIFHARVVGVISNTGTPNLTVRWVLKTGATVTYALAATGAVVTTAGLSGSFFATNFEGIVTATGASGSIMSTMDCWQLSSANSIVAPASGAVDTTQPYTLDCLVTWGTASASNTLTAQYAYVGITG